MERLRAVLAADALKLNPADYYEETTRGPWWLWADQMWHWGAEQEVPHVLFTQDDALAAPDFLTILSAMISARPDDVLALHTAHPAAMILARQGVRWCSTIDGLIGLGYVFPRGLLAEFLKWREEKLKPRGANLFTEDSLINCWLVATGRRALHPIPTVLDHDVSLASFAAERTCGRPRVLWSDEFLGWNADDLKRVDFWRGPCQHLGRMYAKTHWAAKMIVEDFDKFYEAEADECPPEYARFFNCA